MKKFNLMIMIISLCMISATDLYAQNEMADQDQQQKIIKVCSLNSIEANQEFQRNVQLLRAQRQKVIELKAELDTTKKKKAKKNIQKELDDLLLKLNENNQTMFKTYGFSLTRNYTQIVEQSHVYMLVSDVEADKFNKLQSESTGSDSEDNEEQGH